MNQSDAIIISSESFRGHHYGHNHPLSIPRVALTIDLITSYRVPAPHEYCEARKASFEELTWFHTSTYVNALQECQDSGRVSSGMRRQFNLGNFENPFFDNMFTIPALAAGGSIQGAELVLSGSMAFNPAGGMHHAVPGKARGFCYFNDAVLGIIRLRKAGWRILYFDLDAHHGDGVQQAFEDDPDVLTVSFHMDTAYAYPRRNGNLSDIGSCGTAVNLPLPKSVNDSEYRLAFQTLWPKLLKRFNPDAVVLQTGTDILYNDPLGKFNISNRLFLEVVAQVKKTAPRHPNGVPRLLVLGGGGYHPISLARCWTGVWNILADWNMPASLPDQGRFMLQNLLWKDEEDHDPQTLFNLLDSRYDDPMDGPVRDEISLNVNCLLHTHPFFSR
ncbi:MAG: acetoin utilization protein AcuC [Pseudomonadota bacterium]